MTDDHSATDFWRGVLEKLIADGEIEDPRELWKELHPGEAD